MNWLNINSLHTTESPDPEPTIPDELDDIPLPDDDDDDIPLPDDDAEDDVPIPAGLSRSF